MADETYYDSVYTGEQIDEGIGKILNGEIEDVAHRAEVAAETAGRYADEAQRVVDAAATAEAVRVAAESARVAAEAVRVAQSAALRVWEVYSPYKSYVPLNKVSYGGRSYVCQAPCRGQTPNVGGGHWLLLADKGQTEKTGHCWTLRRACSP